MQSDYSIQYPQEYIPPYIDWTPDDPYKVELLRRHPEVLEVIEVSRAPKEVQLLPLLASNASIRHVRGQLEMLLEDRSLPNRFATFMVKFDSEGIIETVWGSLSLMTWPDTHIFKLI